MQKHSGKETLMTKSQALQAIKLAVKQSLAIGSKPVKVQLPGWEEYSLSAKRCYPYRVQKYPSIHVVVAHDRTYCTVWNVAMGELDAPVTSMVERAKTLGWSGPVVSDEIPVNYWKVTQSSNG
jgi:hypothetical protein